MQGRRCIHREESTIHRGFILSALAVLFLAVLLLFAPSARADGTASLEGGEGQLQLYVRVGSDFDLAESGHAIPMEVLVTDVNGIPQAGVPVRLSASLGQVTPDVVVTDAAGVASFVFTADVAGTSTVRITATTDQSGAAQGVDVFSVRVVKLPPPPIYARAEILSLGVLSGLALLATWTETGRHAFFGLFFPLYTRIKKEQVLDHFLRGQVFGVIKSTPGSNFTSIRKLLSLSNGTLSYHLRTLESTGFIVSERDGLYKRFFPADLKSVAKEDGIRLSELQRRLLARLEQEPDVRQRDLARDVGVTQQCVSYNLRMMRRLGVVARVKTGRRHRYVAVDG